jgi:FKBP-type peptidyl-prolyl cis-trans isomerase
MRSIRILLALGLLFIFSRAQAQDYKTTPSGLRYKIHRSTGDRKANMGDVINLHLAYYVKDSMIFSSWKLNNPIVLQLSKPTFQGDLMEGLAMLSKGDSATFWINGDSVMRLTHASGVIPPGSYLRYEIKILDVNTIEEYKAKQAALQKEQLKKDTTEIKAYLKKNKIKARRTASGIYIQTVSKGSGPKPTKGQTVSVHYIGTFMNGKKFDSSRDRNQPFEFVLGQHQVIEGWDEGIAMLNKGTRAILYIPSSLAYGPNGNSGIPPNSVLLFDVELLDIK